MANLYYNGAVNSNWSTLGNWWTNEACTTPAASLPSSGDDVFITAACIGNSGSVPTVSNLTMTLDPQYVIDNTSTYGNFIPFCISINVTNTATFNDYAMYGDDSYPTSFQTGPIVLNCASGVFFAAQIYAPSLGNWGLSNTTVNGNVSLTFGSYSFATLNGDVTLESFGYYNSYAESIINGSVIVNAAPNSTNYYPFITSLTITTGPSGSVTFNGDGILNTATINGDVIFNGGTSNYQINIGTINGNVSFHNLSTNGTYPGSSIESNGYINGEATFYDSAYNDNLGVVSGICTFEDDSYNYGDIFGFIVANGSDNYIATFGSVGIVGSGEFNGSSTFQNGNLYGNAVFNDDAALIGSYIQDNVTFNDNSVAISPNIDGNVIWNGHNGFKDNIYGGQFAGTFIGGRRIVYYNNATEDGEWRNGANWWADSSHTVGSGPLPNIFEDAVINGDVSSLAYGDAVVNYVAGGANVSPRPTMNITLTTNTAGFNFNIGSSGVLNVLQNIGYPDNVNGFMAECTNYGIINISPSGSFQLQGSSNNGTINGNCRLVASFNNYGGIINGDCLFNPPDSMSISYGNSNGGNDGGSINGVCSFYTNAFNRGNITGNCNFYDSSWNESGGSISGNVNFYDNSGNGLTVSPYPYGGTIVGNVTFNDSSTHIGNGSYFTSATITGNVTYNDNSYRSDAITYSNNVVFNSGAYMTDSNYFYDIDGNSETPYSFVTFNDYSYFTGGNIYINLIMNDYSYMGYGAYGSEASNTFNDYSYIYQNTSLGAGFEALWTFNDNSYIGSNSDFYTYEGAPNPTLVFNHNSHNDGSIIANTVTFYDSSYNNGPITSNSSTFKDSSYNSASGVITGDEIYNDRTPYPIPRGINGSSILGII